MVGLECSFPLLGELGPRTEMENRARMIRFIWSMCHRRIFGNKGKLKGIQPIHYSIALIKYLLSACAAICSVPSVKNIGLYPAGITYIGLKKFL